jgi:DNA-binding transcriptional LysR family regulator
MRIEQLQAFLAVMESGSFQQAARSCDCTQSTISRQIQSLEEDLGIPLFHRHHQAKLTIGGERLLPHARKICHEWQLAHESIESLLAGKQPELCVAAIHSVCANLLPPILQKFCHQYPDVQLRVTALGSDRALKVLKDGLVDVAIVMDNRMFTVSPDLVVQQLYHEPIEILMSADHPLAQYAQVPWAELVKYPQVVFKDGYGMQRLVQEQFSKQGCKLQAVLELNTLDAFRGVVRQGKLIALLPQSALLDVPSDPTLAARSIESISQAGMKLSRQVVLVTTTDRLQIPPIQFFCDLIGQQLKVESREFGRKRPFFSQSPVPPSPSPLNERSISEIRPNNW